MWGGFSTNFAEKQQKMTKFLGPVSVSFKTDDKAVKRLAQVLCVMSFSEK